MNKLLIYVCLSLHSCIDSYADSKAGCCAAPNLSVLSRHILTYLEYKCLIEDRVQCFLVDFGVILLLLLGQDRDFYVGIRGSTWVHGNEVRSLKDANCELCAEEVWVGYKGQETEFYQREIEKIVQYDFSFLSGSLLQRLVIQLIRQLKLRNQSSLTFLPNRKCFRM